MKAKHWICSLEEFCFLLLYLAQDWEKENFYSNHGLFQVEIFFIKNIPICFILIATWEDTYDNILQILELFPWEFYSDQNCSSMLHPFAQNLLKSQHQ